MAQTRAEADGRKPKTNAENKVDVNQTQINQLQEQLNLQKQQAAEFALSEANSLQRGKDFGKEVIGTGLGRLQDNKNIQSLQSQQAAMLRQAQQRQTQGADIRQVTNPAQAADMNDIALRLRNAADTGLSSAESLAMKEKAFDEANRSTQTASRRVQALLGTSGVKGASAGRQLLDVETQGMQNKQNISRDLFLAQEEAKRAGLNNMSSFALARGGLDLNAQQLGVTRDVYREQADMARFEAARASLNDRTAFESQLATFDLGQVAKEKNIMLQSGLGFAALGQANTSAALAAQKVNQQQSGGGKVLCTLYHELGFISDEVIASDHAVGNTLAVVDPELVKGYHFWAKPLVKLIKRFPILIPVFKKPVVKWANSMHFDTEPGLFFEVGIKISRLIGKCLR